MFRQAPKYVNIWRTYLKVTRVSINFTFKKYGVIFFKFTNISLRQLPKLLSKWSFWPTVLVTFICSDLKRILTLAFFCLKRYICVCIRTLHGFVSICVCDHFLEKTNFQKITTSSTGLCGQNFIRNMPNKMSQVISILERKHLEIKFPYSCNYDPIIEVISSFFMIIILQVDPIRDISKVMFLKGKTHGNTYCWHISAPFHCFMVSPQMGKPNQKRGQKRSPAAKQQM